MTMTSWRRRRLEHAKNQPTFSIRDVQISPVDGKCDQFRVSIRGTGFRPWAVPPRILVDGVALAQPRFSKDGTAIAGLLDKQVDGNEVEVDLGYHRAYWKR